MGETQLTASRPELYERLIDRLGLALEVARTSVRLRDEKPAELELSGLSHAEFEVIKAYLDSLPERHDGPVGSYPQAEPASAKIIWLKDKKRTASTAKSRTLPHR
ncbi:hypothetical protein HP546_10085 [Pseudomonas sp. CM25]|uniref:hypothetical protein n=1 Tax=unclassified Pseudomonas TaxID=196821 RepID=UPI00155671DB|nr:MULTISPECIES: hypothetical protein [unclassified Pseudomonas]NQD55695.1 hypothetical protein [Pseudomonas sp. CM25]NQD75752.1 hypothetical protein [Pseudomonas sp. CM27]HEN8802039.1 hypothetical protein [Pseudomonas putida]